MSDTSRQVGMKQRGRVVDGDKRMSEKIEAGIIGLGFVDGALKSWIEEKIRGKVEFVSK